jgi:MFS family permease
VPPILPALQARARASDIAASLIFSGFSVGMIFGFVLAGFLIARRGPRAAALAGALLHLTADLLVATGHTATVYSTARVIQGLGAGCVWMAAVFAVLVLWPDRPEARLGRILTGFAVGSVVGPLLAALGGTVRPFVADAALASIGLLAASRFPSRSTRAFGWHIGALRSRRLVFALVVIALVALVISVMDGSYTLHFATRLSQTGLALLFTVLTVAYGLGAMLPTASHGLRQAKATAQVGSVLAGLFVLAIGAFDSVAWWFVLAVLLGAAQGAAEASVLSIASDAAEGGLITAIVAYSQAFAIGFLIGPPMATWLTTRFSLLISAAVVAGALVLAAAAGFLVPATEEQKGAPRAAG